MGQSQLSLRSNKGTLRGQLSLRSTHETAGVPVRETGVGLGEEEDGHHAPVEFVKSHGLTAEVAAELLRRYGRNELEEKKTPKWIIFGQQLIQPMPLMIWYAAPQPWVIYQSVPCWCRQWAWC